MYLWQILIRKVVGCSEYELPGTVNFPDSLDKDRLLAGQSIYWFGQYQQHYYIYYGPSPTFNIYFYFEIALKRTSIRNANCGFGR